MSKINLKNFTQVTFYMPGSFMPETSVRKVDTSDPGELAKLAPKGTYCFVIENFEIKSVSVDGEDFEKTEPVGKAGGRFYLGGDVYTSDELRKKFAGDQTKEALIGNMENNDWPRVIQCPRGNWQPFMNNDVLLETVV